MNEHKESKFIIDVSSQAKVLNRSTTRFFSYDSHTAEIVIQAEKDGKLIDQALVDTVEIYFESVNNQYLPTKKLKWNDTMDISTDGLYSYILPDDFLNYEGLVAFDVYINYKNGDKADSSNRIIFEQRISAIDRAAGAVELVYIKDMETAKREITEQATEITENFLREWNAFEAGSTAKMQELEQRIYDQTEIFNNADVYNKAEMEDKLEPFALQTDIAEVSAQLAQTTTHLNMSGNAVKYFAHRGAEAYAPENTMKSFEIAAELGFDGFELDTATTSDGHWVIMHDDTVDRTTNGTGTVSSLTLAQIQAFNIDGGNYPNWHIGLKVPLLEDVLKYAKKKSKNVLLEIKSYSNLDSLRSLDSLINKLGMSDTAIVFAHYGIVANLKSINSNLKAGVFYSNDENFKIVLENPNVVLVGIDYSVVSEAIVKEMHSFGKKVNVYTIQSIELAKPLIDMGVDIITGGVANV